MDLVRENRYLDKAYKVYISTFRQARAVYYNIYYIRTACLAVYYIYTACLVIYNICTACLAIYNIRTACLAVFNIRTACLAVYDIRTACLAVYNIRAAYLAVYYYIYYICAAPASTGISRYLTTSPIYPWPVGTAKEI